MRWQQYLHLSLSSPRCEYCLRTNWLLISALCIQLHGRNTETEHILCLTENCVRVCAFWNCYGLLVHSPQKSLKRALDQIAKLHYFSMNNNHYVRLCTTLTCFNERLSALMKASRFVDICGSGASFCWGTSVPLPRKHPLNICPNLIFHHS